MSDPVEDGVRLLRENAVPHLTNTELAVIVRNIIAPAVQAERDDWLGRIYDERRAAVQAERERIRTGVRAAFKRPTGFSLDDLLALIDGQRQGKGNDDD